MAPKHDQEAINILIGLIRLERAFPGQYIDAMTEQQHKMTKAEIRIAHAKASESITQWFKRKKRDDRN